MSNEYPSFKYQGEIEGAYMGIGYVAPGKVITPDSEYALEVIKKAPEGLFVEYKGKDVESKRPILPEEIDRRTPDQSELNPVNTPEVKIVASTATTGEIK